LVNLDEKPNVLMVMIDSLRPDRLGCGGNRFAKTPHIDSLAAGGSFMERCFCPMPSSVPSRATVLTGRFPHAHGVRINDNRLPPKEITLTQLLAASGYTTAATPMLYPGLEKGFSHVEPVVRPPADAPSPERGKRSRGPGRRKPSISPEEARHNATLVTDAALRWLESRPKARWFLWVDYESIHEPWRPPEPYASMFDKGYDGPDLSDPKMYEPDAGDRVTRHLRALYDGEVVLVDKGVGRILGFLREMGLWDDTLIVLVSDHGVFLGEHGFFKKPPFLFEPLMRSSFIVSWPKGFPAGRRPKSLVHLCDVMPTVLDLLELPLPDGCQGASLVPLLRGALNKVHDAVFMEFCEYKGTAVKAVRTEDWKYIYHRSVGNIPWSHDYAPAEVFQKAGFQAEMLLDLSADPEELKNLAQRRQDVARKMRSLLMDWMIDTEDDVPWA